jgi:hypothetical protein
MLTFNDTPIGEQEWGRVRFEAPSPVSRNFVPARRIRRNKARACRADFIECSIEEQKYIKPIDDADFDVDHHAEGLKEHKRYSIGSRRQTISIEVARELLQLLAQKPPKRKFRKLPLGD